MNNIKSFLILTNKYRLLLLILVLTFILAACGGNSSGSSYLNKAPADTAKLYKANCISCHGTELQGRVGPSTNLQQVGARMTQEEIVTRIEEGKGSMKPFKDKLTDEQINKLAEWLASNK